MSQAPDLTDPPVTPPPQSGEYEESFEPLINYRHEAPPKRTNPLAVATLASGIVGLVPVALILGVLALRQVRRLGDRGRGVAIAGLAVSGLWVLVYLLVFAVINLLGSGTDNGRPTAARDVVTVPQVGQCINGIHGGQAPLAQVPCDKPHDAEVFAEYDLPPGDYPGIDQAIELGQAGCRERLTPALRDNKELQAMPIPPTEDTWNSTRSVACLIVSAGQVKLTQKYGG
ncbi:DUF4190 domain-containing protein [Rhizohabitans arisaemae]|uniref:DUF4190 domain-containing protein n=1 Tax=Rhizohabitans arisaemae TaxID=2720610 RepID=UPI0024B19832|nr:DUF4190 domain-containing protein [Rhizohabitans arisaemae]